MITCWHLARRCSTEDLDNERGAVMEEWRSGKDSRGRVAEAQWRLIMQGTKVCRSVLARYVTMLKSAT